MLEPREHEEGQVRLKWEVDQRYLIQIVCCCWYCWWYNGTLWSSPTRRARSLRGWLSSPSRGKHHVSVPVKEKPPPGGSVFPNTSLHGLRHQNYRPWLWNPVQGLRPFPFASPYPQLIQKLWLTNTPAGKTSQRHDFRNV